MKSVLRRIAVVSLLIAGANFAIAQQGPSPLSAAPSSAFANRADTRKIAIALSAGRISVAPLARQLQAHQCYHPHAPTLLSPPAYPVLYSERLQFVKAGVAFRTLRLTLLGRGFYQADGWLETSHGRD